VRCRVHKTYSLPGYRCVQCLRDWKKREKIEQEKRRKEKEHAVDPKTAKLGKKHKR
jgi:hypothetical protein